VIFIKNIWKSVNSRKDVARRVATVKQSPKGLSEMITFQ